MSNTPNTEKKLPRWMISSEESNSISQRRKKTATIGRRLFDRTVLWQDWGEENTESAARYWELYTDLLLVAAASALADQYMEHQNLFEFFLLFSCMTTSWLHYTHHYTSRFQENSLAHSAVLYMFVSGMALSIINVDIGNQMFILATLMQRFAFSCMLVPIIRLERAHRFGMLLLGYVLVSMILLLPAAIKPKYSITSLTLVAILDTFHGLLLSNIIEKKDLVPINIDHSKDRLGVLIMVMLGETIISVSVASREIGIEQRAAYYTVLVLSFLLIYLLCLINFNAEPPPTHHAFRRSRSLACIFMVLHNFLAMTCLTIGVSIKLAVEFMSEEEEENNKTQVLASKILATSVGFFMLFLIGMRLCHYGGLYPPPTAPKRVYRLSMLWWFTFAVFGILPFLFVGIQSIMNQLTIQCGLLLIYTILETYFTHVLEDQLPREDDEHAKSSHEESPLLTKIDLVV